MRSQYISRKLIISGRDEVGGGGKSHLSSLTENRFSPMIKWFLLLFFIADLCSEFRLEYHCKTYTE